MISGNASSSPARKCCPVCDSPATSGHVGLGSVVSAANRLRPARSHSEMWMCPELPGRPWMGFAMKHGVMPCSMPRDFARNLPVSESLFLG